MFFFEKQKASLEISNEAFLDLSNYQTIINR